MEFSSLSTVQHNFIAHNTHISGTTMSRSLVALQEDAFSSGESFYQRYIKSSKYKGNAKAQQDDKQAPKDIQHRTASRKFYRSRDHEASPSVSVINLEQKQITKIVVTINTFGSLVL